MRLLACLCVVLSALEGVSGLCPSQCSCDTLSRDGDVESRVVLCNDPDMTEVPTDVPVDTVKLRIEKTAVRSLPADAFYHLAELRCLCVSYNSVASLDARSLYNLQRLHELRLDGNGLAAFPWASLRHTPRLRTLVLRNNAISSVPAGAVAFLTRLTFLDLSSNRLATLPPDFLDGWSHLAPPRSLEPSPGRVVLGLQDNPWLCDCHISRIIELTRAAHPALVLLDPLMMCSGPERLAGVLFQRAALERCVKPAVRVSATQITSAPGSNVLLRCDATGDPTPRLSWVRADGLAANHTVIQESPAEGERWSVISLPGVSHQDAGEYTCRAQNLAGTSEAVVAMKVLGAVTSAPSADAREAQPAAPSPAQPAPLPTSPRSLSPSSAAPTSLSPSSVVSAIIPPAPTLSPGTPAGPGAGRKAASELGGEGPPLAGASRVDELASRATPSARIENLRVAGQTPQSVTLAWDPGNATWTSEVTVLLSGHGDEDLRSLPTASGQTQVTIVGLQAGQRYTACVCPRGAPPRTRQCISFSTEGGQDGGGVQGWVLLLASGAACLLVLPLLLFLLYKVCRLRCSAGSPREDDLAKETYIQFESLSPGVQGLGGLWAPRPWEDCERPLLCSCSSRDSPVTRRSEASRPECRC